MGKNAEYWIERLSLVEHPEGGYFAPAYRASERTAKRRLPGRLAGDRAVVSSIYYLLRKGQFSAFHRLSSTEIWNFYAGTPLTIYILDSNGSLVEKKLGRDPDGGESFQAVIEPGQWFGAKPRGRGEFSLVGCTVVPGFEWEDFELAKRDDLIRMCPRHRDIIAALTR